VIGPHVCWPGSATHIHVGNPTIPTLPGLSLRHNSNPDRPQSHGRDRLQRERARIGRCGRAPRSSRRPEGIHRETHLFGLLLLTGCEPDSRGVLGSVVPDGGGVTLSTQVTAWGFQTEPAGHSTGSALACSATTMFANAANSKRRGSSPHASASFRHLFLDDIPLSLVVLDGVVVGHSARSFRGHYRFPALSTRLTLLASMHAVTL
jgi:hypothetical protein